MTDSARIAADEVLREYHRAADRFGGSLDVAAWVDRLREVLPRSRRSRPVTVWRGQAADRELGLSWTLHRGHAEHYARRHRAIAATVDRAVVAVVVIQAVAPAEAVLGRAHGDVGDDAEVLVDPRLVAEVERSPVL